MIYEFSDLTLDLDRHLLTRGGQPIKLTKLSFKVLQALVQAAPALISHDDLIDQVWGPKRVITPDNLSQRMKTLRQSLGDDPSEPKYIEGIRGEGYRLVPEVRVQSSASSGDPSGQARPRGLFAAVMVVLLAVLGWFAIDRLDRGDTEPVASLEEGAAPVSAESQRTQQPAVAVMPFTNLSADASNQFFADGIHDDLLTRISNIRDIKTISRTSVMAYRNSDKKLRTIARELGVTTILEGGVQRSGDQVRINLQLIDAETDAHLWAQTYTRALSATDVFAVQAEITEAVADALQAILSDDERQQVGKLSTANLQALDAYFKGNQYYDLSTSAGFVKAIDAYQEATELDPGFALAYSKQALAVLEQVWFSGLPAKTQLEKSRPLIDQAIVLDPQSSEAFNALGMWFRRAGDTEKAVQAFQQAMALGPNNASTLVNYGNLMQWDMFDPTSAIELYRSAIELDPQNIGFKTQLAQALPSVGKTDEGIRIMEGIVAQHPDSAVGYRDLALLYSNWEFRHDKGIRALRMAYKLDPNHPMNSFFSAIMHWRLGDYDNTALWMNHIASLVPNSEEARVYRGWAYIAQRDIESAREEFRISKSGSPLYWLGVIYLGNIDTEEGRPDEAIERYRDYAPEFDGMKSNVNLYYGIAAIKAYRALGEQGIAQALVDELLSIFDANPSITYHDSAIHEASIYALSGQMETAIETLEEWVNGGGATSLLQHGIRHGLAALDEDPRYQLMLVTVDTRLSEQRANLARWESNSEIPLIPLVVADPR
jgi:TolB-like protein/DNA-binding winged helix-turn-helix (wHTH) protein/quercetin dioxygenase-like cupin family protein